MDYRETLGMVGMSVWILGVIGFLISEMTLYEFNSDDKLPLV